MYERLIKCGFTGKWRRIFAFCTQTIPRGF